MPKTDRILPPPPAALDKLIAAHDGDVALLYLYLLRVPSFDAEQAAHALCRTLGEIRAAEEKLRRMGLFSPLTAVPDAEALLPPEDKLPAYTAEDLVQFSQTDERLSIIYTEAAQVFGRKLSGADMNMLCGVYRHLGLPAEVILELLNYCAETAAERKPGSRPSPRAVEKEAYVWVNREILTLEQAEEYIRTQKQRREAAERVKAALGIHGRELTPTERKYIVSWLELGFEEEAIAIAYDRTVTNTGSLRWPYLNKILLSWHEKKLHSPEEIEAGDGRRRGGHAASGGAGAVDMEELRSVLDKI